MERKKAMALAATVTAVLGSTTVALAAVGGVSVLGFGAGPADRIGTVAAFSTAPSAHAPRVVTRTRDVYDKVVVASGRRAATGLTAAAVPVLPQLTAAPPAQDAAPGPTGATHRRRESSEDDAPRPPSTTWPTVDEPDRQPATGTTFPVATTTTRPPGVPADWPPGKPIPPMPPNCRQPQLEDSGVWNCQDD